jgi:hypothetical protein
VGPIITAVQIAPLIMISEQDGDIKTPQIPEIVVTAPVTKLDPGAKEFVPAAIHKSVASINVASASAKAIDIVAHRKALQDALFDACAKDSPRQMLHRCKLMPAVTTEFRSQEYDEGGQSQQFATTLKCRDSNGFEVVPIVTGLTAEELEAKAVAAPLVSDDKLAITALVKAALTINDVEEKAEAISSLSVENAVSQTGVSVVGISKFPESGTLEQIETSQFRLDPIVVKLPRAVDSKAKLSPDGKPLSVDQLFSATNTGNASINKKIAGRWSLESIDPEMRAATQGKPKSRFIVLNNIALA